MAPSIWHMPESYPIRACRPGGHPFASRTMSRLPRTWRGCSRSRTFGRPRDEVHMLRTLVLRHLWRRLGRDRLSPGPRHEHGGRCVGGASDVSADRPVRRPPGDSSQSSWCCTAGLVRAAAVYVAVALFALAVGLWHVTVGWSVAPEVMRRSTRAWALVDSVLAASLESPSVAGPSIVAGIDRESHAALARRGGPEHRAGDSHASHLFR